jgi:2-polyprenyl-3-methyl-5-hydroxy-6-metoxy-1,4-benzoquinol methylase
LKQWTLPVDLQSFALSLLQTALKSPEDAHASLIENGTPIEQLRPLVRSMEVPHRQLSASPMEHVISLTLGELINIYREKTNDDSDPLHLSMNYSRIFNLVRAMQQIRPSGTVLEVGSLAGAFALTLQRLGYQVTVVDRYDLMPDVYQTNIAVMRQAGIRVVSTSPETEEEKIASLGMFDFVISMAVVEHIPHTPRLFLDMLKKGIRPGGWLLLDTPNLTWYWNRQKFCSGESVNAPIEQQFHSEIPFTGHHREYTGDEMLYMLKATGLDNTFVRYFDYNCLQYDWLAEDHVEYLWTIIDRPEQAGIILAGGQRTS